MKKYNISVIGGDGTGPEVVDEALKVLEQTKSKFDIDFNFLFVRTLFCPKMARKNQN